MGDEPETVHALLLHSRLFTAAQELSCEDDRFSDFADAFGISSHPLSNEQRVARRAEIDALVLNAHGLGAADLEVIFRDLQDTEASLPSSLKHVHDSGIVPPKFEASTSQTEGS